jgi:pre-rRNA-processing protein RIX1
VAQALTLQKKITNLPSSTTIFSESSLQRVLAMAATTLRAVTHRLTTTPVDQLPSIASFLAASLSDCGELLSAPQTQKPGKSDSENAIQVHKLKTRLASLLQDRSVEGRWTAVVLVKATVEAGQWEILRGYEPIVRSLIGILAV